MGAQPGSHGQGRESPPDCSLRRSDHSAPAFDRGFFAAQFIVHAHTRDVYLLEISRRVTPGHHRGSLVGVDLCAALYAALTGGPSTVPRDLPVNFERTVAQFPQEWLRDTESKYLRDCPIDAPWDDPDLLEAMVAMRKTLLG
jgi:hypothetical protein